MAQLLSQFKAENSSGQKRDRCWKRLKLILLLSISTWLETEMWVDDSYMNKPTRE